MKLVISFILFRMYGKIQHWYICVLEGLSLCLWEREMFYLTMHSTHFIYGYIVSDIWLRTNEKGNPLLPHRLLLSINSKGSFICTIPHRISHATAFVTPVVEHWLEREIAQWVCVCVYMVCYYECIFCVMIPSVWGVRCSSVVRAFMVRWVIGSILHGGPIELFLVPASAPWLV